MSDNNVNVAVKVKPMEVKKTQTIAPSKTADTAVTGGSVVDFVGDVKAELKKITWTSPEELRTYTKIVVGATFFLGLGIYCADLFIQSFLYGLGQVFRWIS